MPPLLQAHQRLAACQAACAALAHNLQSPFPLPSPPSPPPPSNAPPSPLNMTPPLSHHDHLQCAAPLHNALSPSFLPQLFAAVHTQHFAAAGLMLPAISRARSHAMTGRMSARHHDALHHALQVVPKTKIFFFSFFQIDSCN